MDDTILFGISSVIEAKGWKFFLNLYVEASGQHINYDKSNLNFFHTANKLQAKIHGILGCQIAFLSSTYLGLPLTIKDVSNSFWVTILERMQKKLAEWKGRFIGSVGKLQFLASSLQSILVYFLSLFKFSSTMVDKLENIQITFLWNGIEEKKRLTLVRWDKVCYLKLKGDLGIYKITHFNRALMTKMA